MGCDKERKEKVRNMTDSVIDDDLLSSNGKHANTGHLSCLGKMAEKDERF